MNQKKNLFLTIFTASLFLFSCGSNSEENSVREEAPPLEKAPVDPKGIGKYKDVELTNPLDEKMIAAGQIVYDVKCGSCHKLGAEKLVGPGWKGVTERRTPEWIMNFVTNVDEMLEKDPEAQAMLEVCMVRMPNQNLSDEEARNVLEFMRKNDARN
jgi:mono/diheme cytochrome c family protein